MLLANWPYTYFAVMPTNERLLATANGEANAETRRQIERRGAAARRAQRAGHRLDAGFALGGAGVVGRQPRAAARSAAGSSGERCGAEAPGQTARPRCSTVCRAVTVSTVPAPEVSRDTASREMVRSAAPSRPLVKRSLNPDRKPTTT